MANTIRIGTFEVSSFKVGLKDPKIYLGDILLYPTGGYKVCYAVVEDITQYTDREYEDVYDKATEKWFKLNNLNQYEQYGIYGSGRTSCEGSTSRLPQGYTEVEYIENTSTAYINLGISPYNTLGDSFNLESKLSSYTQSNLSYLISCESSTSPYYGCGVRWNNSVIVPFGHNLDIDNPDTTFQQTINVDNTSAFTFHSDNVLYRNNNTPITLFCGMNGSSPWRNGKGKCYSFKLTINNNIVRDLVPCKRDSDNKYGMYDIVNDVFYVSPNNVDFSGGEPIEPTDCVTTYEGKLTIDDGYEYEWNGSSWVNLGEVSGSSVVEYIETPTSSPYAGIELLTSPSSQSTPMYYEVDCLVKSSQGDNSILGQKSERETVSYQFGFQAYSSPYYDYGGNRLSTNWSAIGGLNNRIKVGFGVNSGDSKVVIKNLDTSTVVTATTASPRNVTIPLLCNAKYNTNTSGDNYARSGQVRYYEIKIYDNNVLVGDYIPAKNPSTNEYTFYETISQRYCSKIGTGTIAGHETGTTEYPKYYSEKSAPLDNLTFNTLEDAQAYAEANCVYDGMKATIDGDRYYFDSTDENGWVKVLEYYKFEDVTSGGASGWTISGSATYNPDSSYYDDFDLQTTSTSSSYKIAKVTIYGYDHFTYYLRSYNQYSSSYGYVMATNVDEVSTPPSTMSYNSTSAITNTYGWVKLPKSAVNLSNYRRVTYNNLDKTVEHTFYVYFYGRTYSSYVGNATILIPKEQTNENWEQVTFSASSNVSSAQKNLYIDGNNSSNGGTQYWYHRWIVGLPSGSHSSYTNYSNYNYCPNVTSSTFTSVAGEQRQVNFTYDNTSTKTLVFRLTDGSNVLTPTNTVYYNMTWYNSCGVSSSESNVAFPLNKQVKVGGRFRFANSSNRHYIYGYSPNISLNTDYYVDNYPSIFNITYTKLNDEAVTITYTTYDPSDVETPAFKTDITWPYNGGTTSSTTLTSLDVPYTYPYEVSQTNGKFSADGQSYTAGQAARTINFVLYPNNREFATVADMEAYQYAWEGMKATVGDTKYQYKNGEWVENQHSLPDVPFTVNYNAKQYNASTKTLLKTEGQLANVNAVITAGTPTVHDGYLTIASSTRATISGYQNYFNRDNNNPNLTIISKQRTDGSNCHMFANRDTSYNWMYRCYSNKLTLHGSSEQGSVAVTTQPVIESVRVNSSRLLTYNNYTNNTSSTSNFNYGGTNSGDFALFAGYAKSTGEWFAGDFYWVYMCQGTLTDEQVQQVIDYNENL